MSSDKGKQADTSDPYAAVLPVIADLVESGTRAFALSNWEEAIEHFGELSSLTEQTFGQNSARYADSLVMYGRALLQHAIEQNALLAQKTLAEAATGAKPTEEAEQEAMPSKANIAFEGEPDFRQIEEAEQEEQQEDEDEEDDFGAAWAVLDVARVIQESNASDSKARLKYAETLMLLGDVSMESENFAQACVDFQSALEVKKQLLDSDSRELAELFYKVALAHEYNNETAQALELMADVERILASRLEKAGDKDEREGLEDVLEDVRAKIAEWKMPKKKVDLNALTPGENALAEKAREMFKSALESGQVNDLTSLVKKRKGKEPEDSGAKRKSEDEGEDEDADAKRPKNA